MKREGPTLKVEFVELGEGWSGDYDPTDPNDEELLRFDAYVRPDHYLAEEGYEDYEWAPARNGSYCTALPVRSSEWMQQAAINRLYETLLNSLDGGVPSFSSEAMRMSWMDPHWFRREVQEWDTTSTSQNRT